jgi:hypothetical protein
MSNSVGARAGDRIWKEGYPLNGNGSCPYVVSQDHVIALYYIRLKIHAGVDGEADQLDESAVNPHIRMST